MSLKDFFRNAFKDMKESAKSQHEVDKANFNAVKAETKRQERFLLVVRDALAAINYEYSIFTMEFSMKEGRLFLKEGEEVARGITAIEWETKAFRNM